MLTREERYAKKKGCLLFLLQHKTVLLEPHEKRYEKQQVNNCNEAERYSTFKTLYPSMRTNEMYNWDFGTTEVVLVASNIGAESRTSSVPTFTLWRILKDSIYICIYRKDNGLNVRCCCRRQVELSRLRRTHKNWSERGSRFSSHCRLIFLPFGENRRCRNSAFLRNTKRAAQIFRLKQIPKSPTLTRCR